MKTPELTIGIPVNSRIAEDLAPLRDAMRLEGTQGTLKSPYFPRARFRELRSQDIANILSDPGLTPSMDMGIVGHYTMIETQLGRLRGLRDLTRSFADNGGGNLNVDAPTIERIRGRVFEVFGIDAGKLVKIEVLIRDDENDENIMKRRDPLVLSSLPNITRSVIMDPLGDYLARLNAAVERPRALPKLEYAAGKIESLVRNQDFGATFAGVDLVCTGATAREFGLKPLGTSVLTSRPALYRRENAENRSRMITDFIEFFRESAKRAGTPLIAGKGVAFDKKLSTWQPPQI